jgi:hypothetical protein
MCILTGYSAGPADMDFSGLSFSGGAYDIVVIKIDSLPNANILWKAMIGSTGIDFGYGIAVNSAGRVYVTGSTTASISGQPAIGLTAIVLIQYNAAGAFAFFSRPLAHCLSTDLAPPLTSAPRS